MMETNGKKLFDAVNADAVYMKNDILRRYLTGFYAEDGFVIVDKDGTRMYTDSRYTEEAKKALSGTDVQVIEGDREATAENLLKGYRTVAIPFDYTSYPEYKKLEAIGVTLVDDMPQLQKLMMKKNASEIESIQKACTIAEEAFLALLPDIKEGMTETEVAALLEYNMRRFGAYSTSFDTICAFGANAAIPHHVTDDTKLKFGDEILLDFGCKVNGYCSDITRTFLFGDDGKHQRFKELYREVLTAQLKVLDEFKAGMTGAQGDAIARDYFASKGLDKWFTHSLGHGIGLNIHELPMLRKTSQTVFEDGMVYSDEPGLYFEGELGIRIEDSVRMENGISKSFMFKTNKDLVIL